MNNLYIYDLSIKYFLINSFRSSIFILIRNIIIIFNLNYYFLLIINFCLIIKLGIIPFHFWFIDLIKNLNWLRCLILSTWQKLIPFLLLIYLYNENLLFLFILIRGIFRIIFLINQIFLKKIFAYSSINHICWIIISILYRELLWLLYFFIYFLINFYLIIIFNKFKINYIIDIFIYINNYYLKFILLIFILRLGGIPPFLGFIMKWYVIYYLIFNFNYFFIILIIFFSLVILYYYLQINFNLMIINYLILKLNLNNFNKFNYIYEYKLILIIFLIIYICIFLIIYF